ncbi:putative phage abortive infection protein [Peribacillus loiseleuriae]|uniref:Phage abortive infection protein n=1 Tax=Peribacillus loiseleuriae TaxID=1679170 RepID=A0A0K9GSH8_9BACI|nr:putative phage abortive infection protein [Peribacillus loiseleuriae]KMY49585.1 hypothetical protein AC625_08545 [Peribacillus loiseleuriae]
MKRLKFELTTLWYCLFLVPIPGVLGIIAIKAFHIDFSYLGPFGDFFAGTTVPILTFISFLAIVITLKMQKEQLEMQGKQLEMQNEELRNSIDEMKATRKEFELQNKTLSIQRFENTFFQMVNLHIDIVNAMVYEDSMSSNKVGRNSFFYFYQALNDSYRIHVKNTFNNDFLNKNEIDRVRINYHSFFLKNEDQLGHYFRNLYRIVKFIDVSELLELEEKKTYIGILRAQLSSTELAFLLYNSLGLHGYNFMILMHKYNLLDNLNSKILIKEEHFDLYMTEANLYSNEEAIM